MPTLSERLRAAAQYTGLDSMRELLIEAAGALDVRPFVAPTIPDNSQNWRGMDGVTAFHLIERHADGWGDIGKMMAEWLAANVQQPQERKPLTTQQIADANGLEIIDPYVLVAIAITRNAEKAHGIKD